MPDAFNDTRLFHIIAIYGFKMSSFSTMQGNNTGHTLSL